MEQNDVSFIPAGAERTPRAKGIHASHLANAFAADKAKPLNESGEGYSVKLGLCYWTVRSHFTMCGKGFTPRRRAFGSSKAISQAWNSGKPM